MACAALSLATGACQKILGIEDDNLTVRDGGAVNDAPVTVPVGDAGDVAQPTPCVPSDATYCASLCPRPLFCDDFDTPNEPPLARWIPGAGVQNPIISNDGTIAVELDDWAGLTTDPLTKALFARVDSHSTASVSATIVTTPVVAPGRKPRGGRMTFRMRPGVFELADTAAYRYKTMSFGGFGSASLAEGVGITIVDEGKGDASYGVFYTRGTTLIKEVDRLLTLNRTSLANFQKNQWFPVELMLGPRELVDPANECKEIVDGGAGGPTEQIVRARNGILPPQCAALPARLDEPDKWLKGALIVVGAFASNHVRAVSVVDDVVFDYLE